MHAAHPPRYSARLDGDVTRRDEPDQTTSSGGHQHGIPGATDYEAEALGRPQHHSPPMVAGTVSGALADAHRPSLLEYLDFHLSHPTTSRQPFDLAAPADWLPAR